MERGYGGWDGAGDGIEEGVFEVADRSKNRVI